MTASQVIDTCKLVPTREQVVKNDTAKNPNWKPISHSNFVEAMHEALDYHELQVVDSAFALNKTGHLLVGGFKIEGKDLPHLPGDNLSWEMLVRHANDQSHGLQVNDSLNDLVCTNGVMTGELIASHKHSGNFDVRQWAREDVITEFLAKCGRQLEFSDKLRHMECNDARAAKCILEAGLRGIVPLARTVDIYREWKEPVFSTDDYPLNTAYKLYSDFTHVSQKCAPHRQVSINEKAGPLVMEFCS